MGTTLDNGTYLPDEGERNCYEGLAGNWVALDNHLGSTNIHVTINDKQAWDGHVADTTIHVTSADKQTWNSHVADTTIHVTSADKQTWNSHVADTTIHVTSADKQAWNGKQDALSQTQLDAVNSGIDSTKVQQIATNTSDISSLQSGKANDSDVVHKSGNETISGNKTFSSINGVEPSSLSLPSDRSARIDISSYFTNTGTGQSNSYTVPANGYIYLTLSELTNVHCFSRSSGNVTNYAQTFTKLNNSTGALYVLFPVRKNDVFVAAWYTTTAVSVDGAFFIPCQGNI